MNLKVKTISKRFVSGIILFIFLLFPFYILADNPVITTWTMDPPNPGFDEPFSLHVEVCLGQYADTQILVAVSDQSNRKFPSTFGQWFLVSSAGIGVQDLGPSSDSGSEFGLDIGRGNDYTSNPSCQDCEGANTGHLYIADYDLVMPSSDEFTGCGADNLYLHIVAEKKPLNKDHFISPSGGCATVNNPFTIPVPEPYLAINKSAEGVVTLDGDLIVYTITYRYANGGPVTITDVMPSGGHLRYLKAGPSLLLSGQPAVGATSGTLQWTLPNKTGDAGYTEGAVWWVAELNGDHDVSPATIENTADASMPSAGLSDTSTVRTRTGEATMNLTKSQSAETLNIGDTVTYYLEWEINGMVIVNYQNFDELTDGAIYDASPPPGWQHFEEETGGSLENGIWEVVDECDTGDNYILGQRKGTAHYPSLLLDDGSAGNTSDEFCTGMIVTDAIIEDEGYNGADAMVIIRSNGLTGAAGKSVGVGLSIDANPAHFFVQKVYPDIPETNNSPQMGPVYARQWYRVRIWVTDEGGAGQRIRAKIWPRGEPEVPNWDLDYVDPDLALGDPDWGCDNGETWRPGIGEQGGDEADPVRDGYDNFIVYEARTASDAFIEDDEPTGIDYVGSAGGSWNGTRVRWDLGSVENNGGSLTWWGVVDQCDPITNEAIMDSTNNEEITSNEVVLFPICPVVTGITKTANVATAELNETITWTIQWSNNGPGTIDPYTITDPIPAGMNFVGCTGGCSTGGGTITWDLGSVPPGGSGTVTWWGVAVGPFGMIPFMDYEFEDYFGYKNDIRMVLAQGWNTEKY